MLPFRIVDRIKFVVERQLVKGAGFQLLVVAAFIAAISLVGGIAFLSGQFGRVAEGVRSARLVLLNGSVLELRNDGVAAGIAPYVH